MSPKTLGAGVCGIVLGYVLCLITVAPPKTEASTQSRVERRLSAKPPVSPVPSESSESFEEKLERRKAGRIREIKAKQVKLGDLAGSNVLAKLRVFQNTPSRPMFNLFDHTGTLSDQAIEKLGLTEEQSLQVRELVSTMLKQSRDLAATHLQADPIRTDESKGIKAMKISPFESEVAPRFDEFSAGLVKLFGKDKACEILSVVPVNQYFSSFGRYDVLIKINLGDTSGLTPRGERIPTFEIEHRDAESGDSSYTQYGYKRDLAPYFPGVFDVNMEPIK